MAPPRKTRSDSKLDNLKPESRVMELRDGLLNNWSQQQAREWLLVECGETTNNEALTRFYRRHCVPLLQERKQWAALSAEGLAAMARETKAFEEGAIAELMEFAYQFIRSPDGDPEEKRKWFEAMIKSQASKRDDEKLRILTEERAEAKAKLEAATAKAKAAGGITEETLQELEEAAKLL